ncbi:hypothetical protein [Streptomyces beihaiensis]|uniref:hypothetical protein n=1 Tax=Streptomyces beihaiensis TaxID=2984495 RepID=UPI00389982DA
MFRWGFDGVTPTWRDGVVTLERLHGHGSAPHAFAFTFTFRESFTPDGRREGQDGQPV